MILIVFLNHLEQVDYCHYYLKH
uniref:Uncharacterized protein n=1 Tax=Strongyloides stercoralis TaxID=6248 RepID=A0A0K0EL59_STRER